jgi:hypothetical protein
MTRIRTIFFTILFAAFVPPPARPGVVEKEGTTNSSGVIEFEIENEAILTVEALQITGGDSLYGKGTVKFEKNETTRQSITIRKIQ